MIEASAPGTARTEIIVPEEILKTAAESIGALSETLSKIDRHTAARDFLDLSKAFKRAAIIERYAPLRSAKLLEIGSGFGTNLAVWIKHFNADAYGVEPGSEGFDRGYSASRKILAANRMDPDRVIDAAGESLPFPDESFDIVYSANALEHTGNPERVLMEALRVLRPHGLLHMEMPNYLSYYEGHYLVVQPPIVWKPMLAWWVKLVFRRDPAFAGTLQTKINPIWCRRTVRKAARTYPLELISIGEELFLERLSQPFVFETEMVAGRIRGLIGIIRKLNVGNWIGRLIVALQGHFPIYLTVRKRPAATAS